MKKIIADALSVFMLISLVSAPVNADETKTETISYNYTYDQIVGYTSDNTYTRQMEKLNRGLIAVKSGNNVYLSWRLFDSEDARYGSAEKEVSFKVYRDSQEIATVTDSTNYADEIVGASYSVAPIINGIEGETCEAITPQSSNYFDIQLQKPENLTLADGVSYAYTANDVSCGDLDGDGEYELVLKWDCNGKDNSQSGYTGNVLLDAYEMDGTFLWRIDLGTNIRTGAHYTQFMVYDLDSDGKAEIACKTAPGSMDGAGEYVNQASLDENVKADDNSISYVGDGGFITSGPEYYTVFDGEGKAIDTIPYLYSRDSASGFWGLDSAGRPEHTNRVDRFLGAIAYLDGVHPSVVAWRGYYDRTTAAAYTLENGRLKLSASFDTDAIDKKYIGQGNHNLTVADVDNDGKDEVICGALCLDDDFSVLWCSGRGHGDALHIGDYDPTNPGLEYFSVHESGGYEITQSTTASQGQTADYGMTAYRAATGEELFHQGASGDTGRGVMANTGSGGYYQISGSANYQAKGGTNFTGTSNGPGSNFRIFWDGDLYDEILDGTATRNCPIGITSFNGNKMMRIFTSTDCVTINDTKKNPALTADLFGDWREELVMAHSDSSALRVYTTTTPTTYKIKTLMHDPIYRSGVAAEQTAYNQPPHVGFYMGEEMFAPKPERIVAIPSKTLYAKGEALNLTVTAYYEDGSSEEITKYQITGYDSQALGTQTVTIAYSGKTASFDVLVVEPSIELINGEYKTNSTATVTNSIPIGSYKGAFTIEHTVTINSMPANGNDQKGSTNGFFVRFNPPDGTGAGWYLTANGAKANVYWKSGASRNNATAIATGNAALSIGETYTFKYDFIKVADGSGAAVTMTILDNEGNIVGSAASLNLRNMTNDNQKTSPLGIVQIYNQANSNSTASVSIANASLTIPSGIEKTGDNQFNVILGGTESANIIKAYAAKYDGNVLTNVESFEIGIGEQTINTSFEPDKVMMWDEMKPITIWIKETAE